MGLFLDLGSQNLALEAFISTFFLVSLVRSGSRILSNMSLRDLAVQGVGDGRGKDAKG